MDLRHGFFKQLWALLTQNLRPNAGAARIGHGGSNEGDLRPSQISIYQDAVRRLVEDKAALAW